MIHVISNSLIFKVPLIFQVEMTTTENEVVLTRGNTICQYSSLITTLPFLS